MCFKDMPAYIIFRNKIFIYVLYKTNYNNMYAYVICLCLSKGYLFFGQVFNLHIHDIIGVVIVSRPHRK